MVCCCISNTAAEGSTGAGTAFAVGALAADSLLATGIGDCFDCRVSNVALSSASMTVTLPVGEREQIQQAAKVMPSMSTTATMIITTPPLPPPVSAGELSVAAVIERAECAVTPVVVAVVTVARVVVTRVAVTGAAYWLVIELGSSGSALMLRKVIGWLRVVCIADGSTWVPSVAVATVNVTASEPAVKPVTVTRDDAMLRALAMSIANALLKFASADEPAAESAAMSPGIVILLATAG
jgi:hypothetical protein